MKIFNFLVDKIAYQQGYDDATNGSKRSLIFNKNKSYGIGYQDGHNERMASGFSGSPSSNSTTISHSNLHPITCWNCGENFQISLITGQSILSYHEPFGFDIFVHDISNIIRVSFLSKKKKIAWWEEPKNLQYKYFKCKYCEESTYIIFK